jgi:hypothetical protein
MKKCSSSNGQNDQLMCWYIVVHCAYSGIYSFETLNAIATLDWVYKYAHDTEQV